MNATARIVVQSPDRADAYVPYDHRAVPRSMPGRKWDKQRKCWSVPTTFVDMLADALRQAGVTVYVTHPDGRPWRNGSNASHGNGNTPAVDWVESAFTAVAPEHVGRLRRGLLSALHPDRGADPALAVAINRAADRRERNPR